MCGNILHFSRRIMLTILLTLCFATILTVPVGAAKSKVNFWMFGVDTPMSDWLESVEDRINAKLTDIELDITLATWDQVRTQIFVAVAGGTGPDVAYAPYNLMPALVANSMALPLQDYWVRWPDRTDFIPDVMRYLTFDDKVYCLPTMIWPIFDLYNLDLLTASGVSFPNDWESLIQVARKTTRFAGGILDVMGYAAPITTAFMNMYDMHLALEQLGSKLIGWNDKSVSLDNAIGNRALRHLSDLYQAGGNTGATLSAGSAAKFLSGKIAIHHTADNGWMNLDYGTIEVEPHRMVGPSPGQDVVQFGAGGIYMVQGTKNRDAAWRVMQEFTSPEYLGEWYKGDNRWAPPRKSMMPKYSQMNQRPLALKAVNLISSPIHALGPVHLYMTEFHNASGSIFLKAMTGQMGVQPALAEAERLINAILAEKMSTQSK